jgi:hypothetical protein
VNTHERDAWRRLVEMGASEIELGGKPALDLRTCRPAGRRGKMAEAWWSDFIDAVLNVAGRSGTVRRLVDVGGHAVFVVTDDKP